MSDTASRAGIQVIARAAAILRALREDQSGLSLGQISKRVDLPRSTVQRIVAALQEERLVSAAASGGAIRLGPEVAALGAATRYSVSEVCRPLMEALSARVTETVDLSVLRGAEMVFLDQVAGTHRLRTVSAIGDVFPLTSTANGRAVLAQMGRDQAKAAAQAEWQRRAVDGDWPALSAVLDEITATGLAHDLDEHTDGISAIGVAFADPSGELHALSVPIPSSRFRAKRHGVERALFETLHELHARLA